MKTLKVLLRRTKDCPCPMATGKLAAKLWGMTRGKKIEVIHNRPLKKFACGSNKYYQVVDGAVVSAREKLNKQLVFASHREYFVCEHVVLRECK